MTAKLAYGMTHESVTILTGLMSLNPKACEFLIRPMKNEMKLKSRRKALRDIFNNGGRFLKL